MIIQRAFLVILFVLSIKEVCSIDCYTCSARTNCKSQQSECSEEEDTCQKKTHGSLVEKKCTDYQSCVQEKTQCNNSTCYVYCCKENFCNASPLRHFDARCIGIVLFSLVFIFIIENINIYYH